MKIPGRLREFAWDLAAVSLIPLASFANFINSRGYDMWRPEVFLACMVIVSIAVAMVAFVSMRPETLRPLVFTGLIVVFLYMVNDFFLPAWLEAFLTSLVGPEKLPNMSALIYVLPIAVVFWMLGEKLSIVLVAVFGTMTLASLLLPQSSLEAVSIVERPPPAVTVAGEKPPPLLHLIIDQQIGIDGLPEEVEGTAALRRSLLDFYDRFGFRLYTGAFTHFPATLESIPDMLNGAVVPTALQFIRTQDDDVRLETNTWFEELRGRGYEIDVIQNDYLDYCSSETAPVSSCYTHIAGDIREIQDLDLSSLEKARLLLYSFFDVDFTLLSRTARVGWHVVRQLGKKAGLALPDWDARSLTMSPLSGLAALDVVAERLEGIEAGDAVFAHILLPHDPYILDENCVPKSDLSLWLPHESALWWYQIKADPQRRLARYDEYYKQVICLHQKLAALFEILERRDKLADATIIVHGDHGSRISLIETITGSEHLITPRDIIDSVSTVFAIRGADIEPGAVGGQHSIQALFAELALGRDDITDHNDIFLKPKQNVIGPGQTRLPMVPFDSDQ